MNVLITLERFEDFYGRMISFLRALLVIKFLGVLLTCYSLLEPPLLYVILPFVFVQSHILGYASLSQIDTAYNCTENKS